MVNGDQQLKWLTVILFNMKCQSYATAVNTQEPISALIWKSAIAVSVIGETAIPNCIWEDKRMNTSTTLRQRSWVMKKREHSHPCQLLLTPQNSFTYCSWGIPRFAIREAYYSPWSATGIASIWIFVGIFHPNWSQASHRTSVTPWNISEKRKGKKTSPKRPKLNHIVKLYTCYNRTKLVYSMDKPHQAPNANYMKGQAAHNDPPLHQ